MTNRTLLIVDDERRVLASLKRHLRSEPYDIHTAGEGGEALEILERREVGVILSDLMMPAMDGIALLERVEREHPDTVRLLLTGRGRYETAVSAINRSRVFGFLTKPWSADLLKRTLAGAFEHHNLIVENRRLQRITRDQNRKLKRFNNRLEGLVRKRTGQLEEAIREGVLMLALAAEAKDDDTAEHLQRLQEATRSICRGLGMSSEASERIAFFSIMHDVGKIHVPDRILRKAGPLNDREWDVMKNHTVWGERILGQKPFYRTAREIARWHHERWDGTGYPDGLKEEEIPLPARVVAVADVFDALIHERSYKPAWPEERARTELRAQAGSMLDPRIVEVFLEPAKPGRFTGGSDVVEAPTHHSARG